ncbi:MAG TPA: DNA polymerase III subunit delta [Chloroflexota bacterium]|nr:DNA polymerase III subunit delta [Chloroflexota bacterium]
MIYLYHGPDDFSIREAVRKQLKAALPADTADLNLTRLPGEQVTVDALRFACEAAPFLADRRAVVVERFFSQKKTTHTEAVGEYLRSVPANTLLLFVEGDAPPKTGPVAKALEAAQVKQQYFGPLTGAALTRWIKDHAKQAGGQFSDQAAQLLATFTGGGDLRAVSNEVDKLVAYAGPGKPVEAEHVRLLVTQAAETNIFALVDAVAQGQLKPALRSLHLLVEGGARAPYVVGMVGRQVRMVLQARDALDRGLSAAEAGKMMGASGFPVQKALGQARAFTREQLEGMHRRVLEADVAVKTGRLSDEVSMELLAADLVRMRG